jgi:hypothetical protein
MHNIFVLTFFDNGIVYSSLVRDINLALCILLLLARWEYGTET